MSDGYDGDAISDQEWGSADEERLDAMFGADEAETPADEFREKLSKLLDEYVYGDSYGVLGSDFQTCSCCGAGGAPGVKFEHAPDCLAGKVEAIVFDGR